MPRNHEIAEADRERLLKSLRDCGVIRYRPRTVNPAIRELREAGLVEGSTGRDDQSAYIDLRLTSIGKAKANAL